MLATYPSTKWVRSAVPTFEPVTMDEVRRQCNLGTNTAHDLDLFDLIKTARETVERDAGIVCCTGTYVTKRNDFPANADWFELPSIRPITAISSITYPDTAGTTQTWSASYYSLDTYTVCPIVKLVYNETWPVNRSDVNGITITVTAGYATQATVPAQAKHACKLLISHWFENRGIVTVGTIAPDISMAYESLIDGLKWNNYS